MPRVSIYLSDDEIAIADAISDRKKLNRSEFMRHLILYQGLCGGEFPLTTKILALAPEERDRLILDIRRRAESNDPIKPQSYKEMVLETLKSDDPKTLDHGADLILKKLLDGKFPGGPTAPES